MVVRALAVCATSGLLATSWFSLAEAQPPAAPIETAGALAANSAATADAVTAELDKLDVWLGSGDNGNRWRAYLHTAEIRAELAKGDDADPAVIARSLQRFAGAAKGLELAPFVAARNAIEAQLSAIKSRYGNDLARLAWASRGDHTPVSAEQFEKIRADLRAKVEKLRAALSSAPGGAKGWTDYLHLNNLTPHLAEGFVETRESLAALDEVLRRFRTNEAGLELPVFNDVAKALAKYRAYVTWATVARTSDSRPIYERFMNELQKVLTQHKERPTIETNRQITKTLGQIDSLGQSPEFIDAMRQNFAHSNIYGAVSTNFVTRAPNRPIDRVTPVRDCILGTSIFGTAHTLGSVQYNVVDSADSVELAIFLQGQAHSRTRGIHKPVQVNSTGTTTYWATKHVTLNGDAFTSTPATAGAETHTRINSIQKMGGKFGERLIEKIAWKRAAEQKPQAERISSSHTRERVLKEFEETVARDLAAARLRYETQLQNPLIRRGVSPEYIRMASAVKGVEIETLFATRSQLGAPGAPPAMMAGHDLAVQVHESAVNNYLPLALSAARIAQETADKPPAVTGNVPNWLKVMKMARPSLAAAASAGAEMVDEAKDRIADAVGVDPSKPEVTPPPFKPYSITLNAEAPASIHFDDNQVVIRVRAALLQSTDSEYKNWDFVVVYEIRQEGDRIKLTRVGEIEVFPTGFDTEWPRQLSAEETGFRSVLKKNMNARANAGESFPKEIPIEPVRLSRFGVLVLRELVAEDGWLTVGWGLP
jgi:hypothetical protein